jgi:predicted MFS family arabinose efflux permease
MSGVTFAFIEPPVLGWSSPAVLTMALLGVVGLAVFLAWERRAASPMLPLSVFAQRQFAAVNAVSFLVYGALTGATFLLPVVLQVVSGYSPLGSGLALLPLTIIMLVLSGRSGQLAARIGPRLQLNAGPLVVGAGLAMLTLVPSGSSYVLYVLPAVVVFGLGLAITVAPLTATAMSSAPADHAGIASAVNNDVARFGGLLAVAILPALAGITGSAYLPRTRSPRDSGPRCSSRAGYVPPEGCSPPSRSPTRPASTPTLLRPSRACTAVSMRLR